MKTPKSKRRTPKLPKPKPYRRSNALRKLRAESHRLARLGLSKLPDGVKARLNSAKRLVDQAIHDFQSEKADGA